MGLALGIAIVCTLAAIGVHRIWLIKSDTLNQSLHLLIADGTTISPSFFAVNSSD